MSQIRSSYEPTRLTAGPGPCGLGGVGSDWPGGSPRRWPAPGLDEALALTA